MRGKIGDQGTDLGHVNNGVPEGDKETDGEETIATQENNLRLQVEDFTDFQVEMKFKKKKNPQLATSW